MDASHALFYRATALCLYLNDPMIYEAHADLFYLFPFAEVGLSHEPEPFRPPVPWYGNGGISPLRRNVHVSTSLHRYVCCVL